MIGRAAVTGATGFIGWHVCEHLRAAGWDVTAIVRPGSTKPCPAGTERVEASLDPASLRGACRQAAVIVHAAGVVRAPSAAAYRVVNVDGTAAVADAARSLGSRLVHVSSLTAVGPAPAYRPCNEDDRPRPITAYGASKLAAETAVRDAIGLRWTIVRPAAVYGPRDRQFLPLFQTARRGIFLRLPNAGTFVLTLAHVVDVARAIELVCRSSGAVDGDTLFIGYPSPASMDDVFRALASTCGRAYRPLPVPFTLARVGAWLGVGGLNAERIREARAVGFVCNVERVAQRLGFRAAIDLDQGFRSTAQWYRENGWL